MPNFNPNQNDITYLWGGGFDESIIKLTISDEALDPALVTKALKVEPTKSYRKGDLSENKKRTMKRGLWQLATPWVATLEFEDNLAAFLAKLPRDTRKWKSLCSKYDCRITIVLRMRTWNRGGEISAEALQSIAKRKLKLELDVYHDADEKLWADTARAVTAPS